MPGFFSNTPEEAFVGEFKDENIRRRFVRRVFSIVALQLIFTTLVIAVFLFVDEVKQLIYERVYLIFIPMGVYIYTSLSIVCCEFARKSYPCNVITLILLTISLACIAGFTSLIYSIYAVLMAAGMTTMVVTVIFFVATLSKFDITKHMGLLLVITSVIITAIIVMTLIEIFSSIKISETIYASLGTLALSLYLYFDIQIIMGGRTMELEPDEVILASAMLYVHIVTLFLYILRFFGNDA